MSEMTAEDQALVRAYRVCFGSETGRAVLNDLMKFCKFRSPMQNNFDEGSRRVFLRIVEFTELSDEQLLALYASRSVNPGESHD